MGKIHEIKSYALTIRESANDGSDFSNPDADYRVLFLGEDGLLHVKDSAGTVTDIASSAGMATDTLWDAAGDLAVGSGANTAARLAIGATNGMAVQRVSGAVAWALPPAYEFDYAQITAPVNVAATAEASATTVITGSAVTYDGSTVIMVEFFAPYATADTGAAGRTLVVVLYDGSTSLGRLVPTATLVNGNQTYLSGVHARRLTPSAAAHTYSIRAYVSAGTGSVGAGAGGSGNYMPAYMRIIKV